MEILINLVKKTRAIVMRTVMPRSCYLSLRTTKPISTKYGFDRGKPVDRFYIEKFLLDNSDAIKGDCLEIVDNTYTLRFGKGKVTKGDALDIFKTKKANIHGDLRNLRGIVADNAYDCIILSQTLNVVDDYQSAIRECYRILKPNGVLLVTLPTISPAWNLRINFWRFTPQSAKFVFDKYFSPDKVQISALGNKTSAECFWLGMAQEDLTEQELISNDQSFPLIIGIKAEK